MSDLAPNRPYSKRAVLGSAFAGAIFSLALALMRGGFTEAGSLVFGLTTILLAGALCGAIVLPPTITLLLQGVPFRRALVGTAAPGTLAAVLASGFFSFDPAITALAAALAFGAAAWWLRRSAPSSRGMTHRALYPESDIE